MLKETIFSFRLIFLFLEIFLLEFFFVPAFFADFVFFLKSKLSTPSVSSRRNVF